MKTPWTSKTLWINALGSALLLGAPLIEGLRPMLPPHYYELGIAGLALLNAINRFFTSSPIGLEKK